MAEGDYEFRPKPNVLSRVELDELVRIAPPAEAVGKGFTLQEPDVDRVISAAKELEGAQVVVDASVPPQQAVETLLRVVRILQAALDVQFSENEEVTADFNELQNNEVRRLREEINRLREMRDQEDATGDIAVVRRQNEDLLDQLDELEQLADQLRESEKEALARRDELEESIKERDKEILKLQTRAADNMQRYERMRDDYNDLRERYRTLSQEHDRVVAEARAQDTKQQSEWKIERLTKDNRALEVANTELRKELQSVKEENLEVSEKIIELNHQYQELLSKNVSLEARVEEVANDKDNLLSIQDELRAELQDKMTLLDEFEDKFNRQYRSWEDEKAGLLAQIEALRREAKVRRPGKEGEPTGPGGPSGAISAEELQDLRQELNDMREDKILLLEAYEQLEADVAKEVDRALSRQKEEMERLKRRVDFLQRKLEEQDEDAEDDRAIMTELEEELKDAKERNKLYEAGVYGLPQAVEEIRQLRTDLTKSNKRIESLVQQINKQAAKVEDLYDENAMLRKKANLGDSDKVDITDIKMQKEATIAQLRALNALLERQVADLEEERRKLRMEMKFRAKYHGQHALEMGLNENQLLLLEEYVDGLKNNRLEEARVLDQMQKRINFLEVRLAEVMAYADIPPSMRPALSEFDPTGLGTFQEAVQAAVAETGPLPPTLSAALPAIKAKEVEAVRSVLSECMRQLRQMSQSFAEQRNISDRDYQRFLDPILGELANADKALAALLKDPAALVGSDSTVPPRSSVARPMTPTPRPGTPSGQGAGGAGAGGPTVMQLVPGDASYLADAIADELRERLRELAKQVADLQVDVAQKDVRITQLIDQKTDLERRIGLTMGDRKSEYVTMAEYEDAQLQIQGLQDQLIGVLEELASREREAGELHETSLRYHTKMQTFNDQVKLLYREYSGAQTAWKVEKVTLEKKAMKAQADADAYKIATRELQTALDTLTKSRELSEVEKEYLDTVRRMAVVQIRQAKLARELEASVSGEKALTARVTELEEEVRDVSSTARGRIRWLESACEQTKRRVEQLYRELESSVPLQAYHSLVGKHTRIQHEYRKLLEEQADAVVAPGQEDVFKLRDDLSEMTKRYDQAANQTAELRAKLDQAEMLTKALQEAAAAAAQQQSIEGKTASKPSSSGIQRGPAPPVVLDNVLGQKLAAAQVQEAAALRRVELVEKERDRVQHSLKDMETLSKELEQRLAQCAAELELARQTAAGLERRLVGSQTKEEVDEMVRRMHAAEAAASEVQKNHSELVYKAEDAERRAEAATRDRMRFLAEITNLKAALRDMSGRSDKAALIGKLHLELDHSRTKESLARNALNRSELQRIELEKTIRRQKQEMANLTGRVAAHQDHAAWSDRQRHEAQAQLQVSLAGRTEAWKARLWARKLDQLKQRNDTLAEGLELARRRILKLDDARQEAELRLEFKDDLASWGSRPHSELAREVARLGDQLLQLRLEKGKLSREDMLLKEKIHYTERVNAELHDLLEKYEMEYFQSQSQLEADQAAAELRAVGLQEEMEKLRERINALLAAKDLSDAAADGARGLRGSRAAGGGGDGFDGGDGGGGGFGTGGATYRKTMAERDEIIALIEALKNAREEAEHLRTDRSRLQGDYDATMQELADVRRHHQDALDRLNQQSEALLYALNQFKTKGADATVYDQMKAVAEATINELKQRIKDRDRLIEVLRKQLDDDAAQMLARHTEDRAEIERLNEKLFERNNASIQDLKSVLDRLPLKYAAKQVPEEQLKLKEALDRAQDMNTILKNRLEQKDAAIDMLKLSYEQELKQLRDQITALRTEAETHVAAAAARKEGPTKAHLQKLQTQLKNKDDLLQQLKGAIKKLEANLTQVMQEQADDKLEAIKRQEDQKKEWERLKDSRERLKEERDLLKEELERLRAELERSTAQPESLRAERDNLMAERDRLMADRAYLREEMERFKAGLDRFKTNLGRSMDAPGSLEEELDTLIEEWVKMQRWLAEGSTSEVDATTMLKKYLDEEIQKRKYAEKTLLTVENELHKFKNARDAVVDLTTGMSVEAKRQIEELQRRINVLEKQNAALKRGGAVEGDGSAPGGSGGGGGGGGGDGMDGPGGGGGKRPPARGPAGRRPPASRRDHDADGGGEDQGGHGQEHDPEAEERRERAILQWEEGKKLNAKIDSLRRQLAAKTNDVVTLQKELDRKGVQAASLQVEADKQAAAIRDLSDKLRRAQEAPRTDRVKLQEYMQRCTTLEEARDALTAELARLKSQPRAAAGAGTSASGPPASPGGAALRRDEDVLELRLQRDQLQLQVNRLKERLAELGAPPDAGAGPGARRAGSAGARLGGGAAAAGAATGITSAREAELLSTITNLKAALEKSTANMTPTTKYMQEVSRRKGAQRDTELARQELEQLKQQLTASSRMVAELNSANAELRRQLRAAQSSAAATAAAAGGAHGVGVAELGLQLSNLEMLLGQRDEEVAALRGALAQRDTELEALRGPGGSIGAASGPEVASLRRQLRELEAENEDLRNELNAFDPSFWDEVMEMKQQHAELSRIVERYEELVVDLSGRLGIPPELQRGGRNSTGRRRGSSGDRARSSPPRRGSR